MALDMLCQEMKGLGSWSAAAKRPFVTARKASLSPRMGCDKNGEGSGERMEKERERRAPLGFMGWPVFFQKFLMSGMVCLWSEGFPYFLCATVWCSWF